MKGRFRRPGRANPSGVHTRTWEPLILSHPRQSPTVWSLSARCFVTWTPSLSPLWGLEEVIVLRDGRSVQARRPHLTVKKVPG